MNKTTHYVDFGPADSVRLAEAAPHYATCIGIEKCGTYVQEQIKLTAGISNVGIVHCSALEWLSRDLCEPEPTTFFIDPHRCRCETFALWKELDHICARDLPDIVQIPWWRDCPDWRAVTSYDISRYIKSSPALQYGDLSIFIVGSQLSVASRLTSV